MKKKPTKPTKKTSFLHILDTHQNISQYSFVYRQDSVTHSLLPCEPWTSEKGAPYAITETSKNAKLHTIPPISYKLLLLYPHHHIPIQNTYQLNPHHPKLLYNHIRIFLPGRDHPRTDFLNCRKKRCPTSYCPTSHNLPVPGYHYIKMYG